MQWIFLYGEEFNQAKTPYVVWSVKWSTIVQIQVYPLICSSENYAYIGIETKEFFFIPLQKTFLLLMLIVWFLVFTETIFLIAEVSSEMATQVNVQEDPLHITYD